MSNTRKNDPARKAMLRMRRELQNERVGRHTNDEGVLVNHTFTPIPAGPRHSLRGVPGKTWQTKKHTKHRLKTKKDWEAGVKDMMSKMVQIGDRGWRSKEPTVKEDEAGFLTFNTGG